MADEQRISELLSLADDLALSDADRFRLAIILGNLMWESWDEGYRHGWRLGWYSGADDISSRAASKHVVTSH